MNNSLTYNKFRTFLICLIIIFYFTELSYTQIPEYFIKTWYLEYFSHPEGEIYVNDLDVSQGPSFTVTENLEITGNSFCNDFSGEYIYVNTNPLLIPHTFQPINITRGTLDCGINETYETHFYEPFMNEQEAEIFFISENYLVFQFYNPAQYQAYRDEPVLNIDENKSNQIQIYPNPVSNLLTIQNPNGLEIDSITFYNTLGRKVMESNDVAESIDISNLTSGVYFIHIITESGNVTKKIIKE